MAEPTQDAERIVESYKDLWNEQDYSGIADVVSESFIRHYPEVHGTDELEEFMRAFTSGFPDFHVELLDRLASEDTVIVMRNRR